MLPMRVDRGFPRHRLTARSADAALQNVGQSADTPGDSTDSPETHMMNTTMTRPRTRRDTYRIHVGGLVSGLTFDDRDGAETVATYLRSIGMPARVRPTGQ